MPYWRKRYRRRRRAKAYKDEVGCLTTVILIVVAMPLAGLHMLLTGKDNVQRMLGMVLMVLGVMVCSGVA